MVANQETNHSQSQTVGFLKMYGGAIKKQYESLKHKKPIERIGTTTLGVLATSPMLALALPVTILKDVTNPNSRTVGVFKTIVEATKAELRVRKDQDPVVKYGTTALGILVTSPMMALAIPFTVLHDITQ
ncbi:MAG: hypothetical protein V1803_03040 [Candidatus Roizmanbacteria bacterium]